MIFSGSESVIGGTMIMPSDIRIGDDKVDDQERQEDHEADLEGDLQFTKHKRRH